MTERISPKTAEEVGVNKRLVRGDFKDSGNVEYCQYDPSRTEIFLEQIASSFGTELLEAYLNPYNGVKLVRLSKPVVLTNKNTKERNLLAMQYTRFSPFLFDTKEILTIYRETTPGAKRKSDETIMKELKEKIGGANNGIWDPLGEVTNERFIPNVQLVRWRKGFYFAVYKIDNNKNVPEEIDPFTIHEDVEFMGELPNVHIMFKREPLFFISSYGIGGVRKDLQRPDCYNIFFPKIYKEHEAAISSASELYPLTTIELNQGYGVTREIDPFESRERVMAFLQAYLRKMCIGGIL